MRDLVVLEELRRIRRVRLESARSALVTAKISLQAFKNAEEEERQKQVEFSQKLPGLVDDLFASCIGQEVGKVAVEEARAKEAMLREQERSAIAKVQECVNKVAEGQATLEKAQANFVKQQNKCTALDDLINTEKARAKRASDQREEKTLQEYVRRKG